MDKGFLISFEGGEGCGKSTQVRLFTQFLQERGVDYILVREPGGTDVGEKIRDILLNDKAEISPQTEFLLFSASRSKLVADVVRPALRSGKIVIMDRYYDSSFAYQGYAGGLSLTQIAAITNMAIGADCTQEKEHAKFPIQTLEPAKGQETIPDVTFLLDIPSQAGFARKTANGALENLDRIEQKGTDYHSRVREGYLQLAKQNPNRIFVVDAAQSIENVFENIKSEFEKRYIAKIKRYIAKITSACCCSK